MMSETRTPSGATEPSKMSSEPEGFVVPSEDGDSSPAVSRTDAVGIGLSVLCAIHCAATPVLVAMLPTLGLSWFESPWVHQAAFFGCFALAGWAILSGYRVHRRRRVVGVAGGGLMLLAASAFVWPAPCCAADAAGGAACETEAACGCCHAEAAPEVVAVDEVPKPIAAASLFNPSGLTDLWLRLMTPLGGCLLVAAHGLNIRWTRNCRCGCCPTSETPDAAAI